MANKTAAPTTVVDNFDATGISDQMMTVFIWVVTAGLCQIIDIFGVVTNIINIMCFVKQGFSEPINISLFGLTIADFGCLVAQIFMNIFSTIAVSVNISFDAIGLVYLIAMIHLAFSRVNNWITVVITLERCLSVTVPLKMKHLVTTQRMWIIITTVYFLFLFSGAPVFTVTRWNIKFLLQTNKTMLGLVFTEDKNKVEMITLTINSFILPFMAFMIIIVCTVILVINLRKRTKWLKTTSTPAKSNLSARDQKVAMMVVMISVLFIVCFVPLAVLMLAASFEPSISVGGKLINYGKIVGGIVLLMESVNSSVNIFIYYHMSTKYRETFDKIVCSLKY